MSDDIDYRTRAIQEMSLADCSAPDSIARLSSALLALTAATLAGAEPAAGRCGTPTLDMGLGTPVYCELTHGHTGMHRSGATEWGWTNPEARESSIVAHAAGTLGELYDARPEDMPVIEWSAKVAAVVEAARAWVASPSSATVDGLLDGVRALEGRA